MDVVDAGRVEQMHHLVAAHRDGSGLQVTPGSRLALSQVPTSSSYQPLLTLILDILVDEMELPGSGALTQVLSDMTRLDRWRRLEIKLDNS